MLCYTVLHNFHQCINVNPHPNPHPSGVEQLNPHPTDADLRQLRHIPRQDYHDFEAPLPTMLLVLASQALTDCAMKTVLFQYSKYTYFRAGADDAAGAVFRDNVDSSAQLDSLLITSRKKMCHFSLKL